MYFRAPTWAKSLTKLHVKNLVISNGSEHGQNVIQRYQNGYFFQKIGQRRGALPSVPVCIRLSYTCNVRYNQSTNHKQEISGSNGFKSTDHLAHMLRS